jgi:hydrogenase nickel incorporation protein HypA/HybF
MHELAVTQNILDIGKKFANDAGARKILKIYLVIGQFASIVDDSVQFYWDLIAKDTLAEGSSLIFKRVPAQFECQECLSLFTWDDIDDACPNCRSSKVKLIAGNEFLIESIEVE